MERFRSHRRWRGFTLRAPGVFCAGWVFLFMLAGCADEEAGEFGRPGALPDTIAPADCIQRVMERDDQLGRIRNHAPETGTLSEAVANYIASIDQLDFAGCPDVFTAAFKRHRDAWQSSVVFFGRFDDLRGEMHALLDVIRNRNPETRQTLASIEEKIWSTWDEVETEAEKYGFSAESPPTP